MDNQLQSMHFCMHFQAKQSKDSIPYHKPLKNNQRKILQKRKEKKGETS